MPSQVDDCDEDVYVRNKCVTLCILFAFFSHRIFIQPPEIVFKSGHSVDIDEHDSDGVTVINSPTFSSLEGARLFLQNLVEAVDDCVEELDVTVSSPAQADCENTIFTVTAKDPRCSTTHPEQIMYNTVVRQFSIKVDTSSPDVSITFDRQRHDKYFDTALLYLHIDESEYNFESIGFSYNVQVSWYYLILCTPTTGKIDELPNFSLHFLG